jgi:hypothetical protein
VNLEVFQPSRREPLVHQDAPMLRVVRELYNIQVAVIPFDQMRLSTTPHFADEAPSSDGHNGREKSVTLGILVLAYSPSTSPPKGKELDGRDEWRKKTRLANLPEALRTRLLWN